MLTTPSDDARARYLELLRLTLTRAMVGDEFATLHPNRKNRKAVRLWNKLRDELRSELGEERGSEVRLVLPVEFDPEQRAVGRDLWSATAETMVGLRRLENLGELVTRCVEEGVPGDVIETGVWRGGALIYAKAVLDVLGDTERTVWVADSFQGLPQPSPDDYPEDAGDEHWTREELAVSADQVRANFERYGLLDDRVRFLEGWFKDTLPDAPIEQLAVARLDGDMYESTIQALDALYHRISPGGYVIIDDFGAVPACREAVEDFRRDHDIQAELVEIDWTGVYWRKDR